MKLLRLWSHLALLPAFFLLPRPVAGQVRPADRITTAIEDRFTVAQHGNRHPLARPEFDGGSASPDLRMNRMILVLQPDAAQQTDLDALLAAQQDPQSPQYHQFLTPESFGELFGVSEGDVNRVVGWLETHGFEVEPIPAGRRAILFSGAAEQVESAFHTQIHTYNVNGEMHYSNATDPEIPQALAGVVHGVTSLHDFRAKPLHSIVQSYDFSPEYTSGSSHYLAPADFATIYNVASLYAGSIDGTGQSVAIAGRTNLKLADVQAFRTKFGLPVNDPTVILNGPDPGIVSSGEQMEAELDVEWSGAVAKKASIQFVVSASTNTTDGIDLSSQYIVNHNLAPVMSVSFGSCEGDMGTSGNKFWNTLWQQAAAQGISVFVASGDSGAAGCDSASSSTAAGGSDVNGLCSSPYSTCVGGTQFAEAATPGVYWSTANNSATYGSALSYIPEGVWNESGSGAGGSGLWSSGGGASKVYSKPTWQSGSGVPSDGARDVPDVSLTAAGHDGYLVNLNGGFYVVSGTSASSPSFAGLMALVTQKQNARQGNANPTFYGLANKQANGGAAVFHDVVSGNNSVPGVAGYTAGAGYDLASGLGSADVSVLVNHWSDSAVPSGCTYAINPTSATPAAGAATYTVTVTATSGCSWTAVSNADWMVVTSGGSGSGNGTVNYSVNANPSTVSRSGSMTIAGLTLTAAQAGAAGATFRLNPMSANVTAAAGSGSVTLTSASPSAAWTAVSNNSWIVVTAGGSGQGNGSVTYSAAANTSTASRTGTILIAGLTFTLTQAGAAATTFTLNPTSAIIAAASGSGSVGLTSASPSAAWTGVSNNSWIVVTAGGSGQGNGSVTYSAAANTSTASRTGTILIAGLTFTLTQAGAAGATFSLSPTSANITAAPGSGSVGVTAPTPGSSWTGVSNNTWITVSAGASGQGSGTVTYSATANTSTTSRLGTISVAGLTFTLTQAGAEPSTVALTPASAAIGATAMSGSLIVNASSSLSWTAASNNTWITVTSGASRNGSGAVTYSATANTSPTPRTGTMTIAGLTFTVTQDGAPAAPTFSLNPASANVPAVSGSGSLMVTASSSNAPRTAVSNNTWIAVTSGAFGTGTGAVTYSVTANASATSRIGTIAIAGLTFTIAQEAAPPTPTFSLNPASANIAATAGNGSLTVTSSSTTGPWTAVSNNTWITITSGASGHGTGTVSYSVAANTTPSPRSGTMTLAALTFTVTQAGSSAGVFSLSSVSATYSAAAVNGSVAITAASASSTWTAVSNVSWINITSGGSGTGSKTLTYTVGSNAGGSTRVGTMTIAGLTFTVTQVAGACSYSIAMGNTSVTAAGFSGSVSVTAPSGCPWTAGSDASWLTINSGASGTGNGVVNFLAAPNQSRMSRSGTLTVAGFGIVFTENTRTKTQIGR